VSRKSRGSAGWLLLNAGLLGLIAAQSGGLNLLPAVRAAAPGQPAPATAAAAPAAPAFLPPAAAVKQTITAQPLFAPDRQPFQPEIQLAQAAEPAARSGAEVALPPLELAGTLLTSQRRAALVIADDREVLRLRPGETLHDWEVGHIDVDHIELRHGSQVEAVQLRKTAAPAPARAALPVDRSVDAAATPECRC
jgi:hypothetical protein